MEPDGRSLPGRGKGCFPDGTRRIGIDAAAECGDRLPCLAVIDGQRAASVEIVLTRRRPV